MREGQSFIDLVFFYSPSKPAVTGTNRETRPHLVHTLVHFFSGCGQEKKVGSKGLGLGVGSGHAYATIAAASARATCQFAEYRKAGVRKR